MFIHITANNNELTFCNVSPGCASYGKAGYPVWMLHGDRSISRIELGKPYYRSKPGVLKKSFDEYTIAELKEILKEKG